MQQSIKAQDRSLGVWFQNIQQGTIKLPRFQRFEAWDRPRIVSFLNTVINNLPMGVTLTLEVGGKEKFDSRYIVSSEPLVPTTVTQHLLDGQQRLTAFWRSMHNNYDLETFFVYLPQFDREGSGLTTEVEIRCIPRWINKNQLRMPRWAEEPADCFSRGLLPVSLLRPGDISTEIDQWLNNATKPLEPADDDPEALAKYKAYTATRDKIKAKITTLRERVTHFNLPYLSLPADTSKDVALQVFINMNTNSKPLSMYDIIVAEVENVAEQSLHALVASLNEKCPNAGRYSNVPDLILSTSALLQDKLPNTRGMIDMDKRQLLDNWSKLERGLERMAFFLASQGIFDAARLPTNAVLAVIAAAYDSIPDDGDFSAKAEGLLRRYMWSSFFTDRYENTAASRAFADFKAIKALLKNKDFTVDELKAVPVLNRIEFPLADADSLRAAGWPKAAGIKARAILGVTTYLGAVDFADHRAATYESIQGREYHHIFPDALLRKAGIENTSLALNCALITKKTNRDISAKVPLDYLTDRVIWADETIVGERLKTHLISFESLSSASYEEFESDIFKDKINRDYNNFLGQRANLMAAALIALADGNSPTIADLCPQDSSESINKLESTA